MKRKISRILAIVIAFMIVVTATVPENIYAAQIQGDTGTEATVSENQPVSEVTPETTPEKKTISENDADDFGEKGKLNYLYLENKYIETPGEQNVLVGYGDEETVIAGGTLEVQNYRTKEVSSYSSEETMENTVLFTMPFSAEQAGIYEIIGFSVITEDGEEKRISIAETGMANVYFGVDEEVVETEDEAVETNPSVEMQIVTFDEEGISNVETEDITSAVEEALENADNNTTAVQRKAMAQSAVPAAAAEVDATGRSAGGDIVVVLDPGHDASHAGARANGLNEEDLTLKIAQYCKEELEQYSGVVVYMTRNSAACPYPGTSSVTDNQNRVAYAKSVGADIYVSIHLNSNSNTGVKGAEVYYPNSHYNSSIGAQGANLATQITRQLAALGLSNRGIKIKNSEDSTLYPDGSLADYYAVIRNSKLAGFPGVIIEHAFLTNASDAAFLRSEENLKKIGVADATGIANYLGISKTINIKSNAPTIQNLNNSAGTFTASVTGVTPVSSVSRVSFAVWNAENGQDDLVWYNAATTGNGTYTANINIKNHGSKPGTYYVHTYAYDVKGGAHLLGVTECSFKKVEMSLGGLTADVSADEKTVTIVATNAVGVGSMQFAVWSNVNGQDDLVWYTAKDAGNGIFTAVVPVSRHRGSVGIYNVHAYASNAYATSKLMKTASFTITGPTAGNIEFKNVRTGEGTFTVKLVGSSAKAGISNVKVAVWSKADQSNLKWYTAKKQSDGSYSIDVDIANHGYQYGVYNAHVYVTDNNGITVIAGRSLEMKQPTAVLTATGNGNQTQFNLKAGNVGYAGGVKGVNIAVWSTEGGQDDLRWYQAENKGKGVWSTNVIIANHRSAGTYNAHMYIIDQNGQSHFAGSTTFEVDKPVAGIMEFKNVRSGEGAFTVKVSGSSARAGIANVRVAVWSKGDQSNLKWYTATRQSDGSYSIDVDIASHGYQYGIYQVHAYVTDNNGVSAIVARSLEMKQPTAVLTATGNGNQTQFNLKAGNVGYAGGVKGVNIAVWSTEGGQDDLRWYQAENKGKGVWSTNVIIANHRSAGTYNAHMYIIDQSGQSHFVGSVNFTVEGPKGSAPIIVDKNENDGVFGVRVTGVSSVSGIQSVRAAVWCANNQSDLIWYTATDMSGGVYQIGADVRNHQSNTGNYQIHVYVTDNNGICKLLGTTSCSMINVTNILHPIMGSTSVTVDQMVAYYNSVTAYPGYYGGTEAPTIRQFCQIYIDECNAEGVKAEVAFVQAMKETNFLRYGGDVDISQFNFAGLGATGNGVSGHTFPTVTIGIRAQIQHLKAYASDAPLNNVCVDPRFQYVARNTAPYCEWLGINENPYGKGWATAVNYGYNVVERMNKLKSY